jgi:curved DNA-binding protein CbpA
MLNAYEVLGVGEDATPEEIKKAFRAQSKLHHPDLNDGNDAKFKQLSEAYETLRDSDRRTDHDSLLRRRRQRAQEEAEKASRANEFDSMFGDAFTESPPKAKPSPPPRAAPGPTPPPPQAASSGPTQGSSPPPKQPSAPNAQPVRPTAAPIVTRRFLVALVSAFVVLGGVLLVSSRHERNQQAIAHKQLIAQGIQDKLRHLYVNLYSPYGVSFDHIEANIPVKANIPWLTNRRAAKLINEGYQFRLSDNFGRTFVLTSTPNSANDGLRLDGWSARANDRAIGSIDETREDRRNYFALMTPPTTDPWRLTLSVLLHGRVIGRSYSSYNMITGCGLNCPTIG